MMADSQRSGFTLIEVMVALLLLSMFALGLTSTFARTQRTLRVSEQWMQAVQLAAEGLEQLRAGQAPGPLRFTGPIVYQRTATAEPWGDHLGLQYLEVTVTWDEGDAHLFRLATLARR